jgi:hypothetical protein
LADSEHVEVLRRGPRSWNDWRRQNPATVPNLIRLSLSAAERQMGTMNGGPVNLAAARLRGASLRFATLSGANLAGADLSGADLTDARLDGANLTNADLSHALLNRTDFAGAKLVGARLEGTNLAPPATSPRTRSSKAWATPSPCFLSILNLRCFGLRKATPSPNWMMTVRFTWRTWRPAAAEARCHGWWETGPPRRRCRNSSRSCCALQNVARFAHDILLDLLLRQPRRGAKREDGDRQYLASVIVLVSELGISALAIPVIFGVDEFEGHGGSLD